MSAPEREKFEVIGIFDELLGKFGLFCRQRAREVCDSLALPLKQSTFDLVHEDVAAPAISMDCWAYHFLLAGLFTASKSRTL